jgi:hypothetical protein
MVAVGVLAIIDVGGARVIDGMGVADRLLSGGVGAIGWVPVIALFFVARLALYWVAPGLVIRGLVLGAVTSSRAGISTQR